ncbi:MAG: tail fiber assembly protein [Pseudomonadota bacterium]|nr:tail fiber assembly protein [Pseudomonadota bacterium]
MIYARVQDGIVQEIIGPMLYEQDDPSDPPSYKAGDEIPIHQRYTSEFVAELIDITNVTPQPEGWWTYDGSVFAAPVPYQPSPEEIKASNTTTRDALLSQATAAIAPLQDAVDLDMATDADTAALKAWKTYRVLVNRADLTQASPVWPAAPSAEQESV